MITELIVPCIVISVVLSAIFIGGLVSTIILVWSVHKKGITTQKPLRTQIMTVLYFLLYAFAVLACIYKLPDLMFSGETWVTLMPRLPHSFWVAAAALMANVCMVGIYCFLQSRYQITEKQNAFMMSIILAVSSIGYTLIIIIITQTLADRAQMPVFVWYFVWCILSYIYGQKIVRNYLIRMTNGYVLGKRMDIVSRLLNSSYEHFEGIEKGDIYASLHTDTETISSSVRELVTVATSIIAVILCFVYLAMMNIYAFLFALLIILVAIFMQFIINRRSDKIFIITSRLQSKLYACSDDLTSGFKELYINRSKCQEFYGDYEGCAQTYTKNRVRGEAALSNGYIQGQLMIYLIIGGFVFGFPMLFPSVQDVLLSNYIFVFMFIVSPISNIIDLMPRALQMRIAIRRIHSVLSKLVPRSKRKSSLQCTGFNEVKYENISYRYARDGSKFVLGPITLAFHPGEITFITGGNGSGKTTLVKLLTGLYEPEQGNVQIDGRQIPFDEIGGLYSGVFSDYHLFQKLYGLTQLDDSMVDHYLRLLKLDEKVTVEQRMLSTTKLSSGQRKRLALCISYLENHSIYLFDEWAADQDPEFRAFFYTSLLPELRERGKCVIIITHDERYFDCSDRRIKMEMGQITEIIECNAGGVVI